jgi:hypothetical protein
MALSARLVRQLTDDASNMSRSARNFGSLTKFSFICMTGIGNIIRQTAHQAIDPQ